MAVSLRKTFAYKDLSAVFSDFCGFCAKFASKSKIPLAFQTVLIYNIEAVRSRCADSPCRRYGKRLWLASAFRLSLDAAKIEAQPLETTEYATVAQLVEQLIRNQQVGGSSPPSSSKNLHTGFVPCESGIGRCRRWRRPENGAVPFSCFRKALGTTVENGRIMGRRRRAYLRFGK